MWKVVDMFHSTEMTCNYILYILPSVEGLEFESDRLDDTLSRRHWLTDWIADDIVSNSALKSWRTGLTLKLYVSFRLWTTNGYLEKSQLISNRRPWAKKTVFISQINTDFSICLPTYKSMEKTITSPPILRN